MGIGQRHTPPNDGWSKQDPHLLHIIRQIMIMPYHRYCIKFKWKMINSTIEVNRNQLATYGSEMLVICCILSNKCCKDAGNGSEGTRCRQAKPQQSLLGLQGDGVGISLHRVFA